VAASSWVQNLGSEVVVRLDSPLDLMDLVLEAQALEELEGLAQGPGRIAVEFACSVGRR
jgi:hypothetical protein